MSTIRITHHYDVGNQDVFVTRRSGDVDPLRAALYCQFKSEEWFDEPSALTNLGIAAMLVMHHGFRQAAATDDDDCQIIDMYREREAACGPRYDELMADASLHREGLRESMANFFD
jgi:hypothetical protein